VVIYRSRLNAKINRNFEVLTPTDFLAAITLHIPDKGVQMVRYYGWYSNKMRGVRQRGLPPELVVRRPGVSPPTPANPPPNTGAISSCACGTLIRFAAPFARTRCVSSRSLMTRAWYPERFAQEVLGHNSKAVHNAYARKARAVIPNMVD
jgi:hypothetical protein